MSLDAYLATQPDRCPGCGHHAETQGHGAGCAPTAPAAPTGEWPTFVAALRRAARSDGTVHQCDVRPLIRGRVKPKHVGTFYRQAKADGLLVDTGDREPSNDAAGRNTDKLDRIYALGRAA